MACNNCTSSCPAHFCYTSLYLFKTFLAEERAYLVKMTNIGSGRSVSEVVTATGEGFIVLENNTWSNFFHTGSEIKIQIFEVTENTTNTNIPVDFYVITGFSGGSYASQDATISTTLYDCIYVTFDNMFDSDGDAVNIPTQYLYNPNA